MKIRDIVAFGSFSVSMIAGFLGLIFKSEILLSVSALVGMVFILSAVYELWKTPREYERDHAFDDFLNDKP